MPMPSRDLSEDQAEGLAAVVKDLRGTRSQPELLRGTDLTVRWLSQIENAQNLRPAVRLLEKLSLALGLPPHGLERYLDGGGLPDEQPAGAFPPATADGHGGSEGWSEFLEEKFNEAVATSRAVRDELAALRDEVRQLRDADK